MAKPNLDFWDVCCDHGKLGELALRSKEFKKIYFVDQVDHQIIKIQQKYPSPNVVSFALDASDIKIPIEGNFIIAGVGAFTINKIISSLFNNGFLSADLLILAPQKNPQDVLKPLLGNSNFPYVLSSEHTLIEKGRERWVKVYSRVNPDNLVEGR